MKKLLVALLLLLPSHADAARLFVRANSDKIIPSEGLIAGGGWTVAAWLKVASQPSSGAAYIFFNDGSGHGRPNPLMYYADSAGTKILYCSTASVFNTYHESYASVTLTTGVWYHVAFVAGSGLFKLYVNGVDTTLTPNGALANEANHGGTIGIGVMRWDSDINFWDGDMGPVARWCSASGSSTTGVLNAAEILALSRGIPPEKVRPEPTIEAGRQYVWPMDGWQTTEPDIGARHSAPGTVTGTSRSNNPPLVPR